MTTITDPILDTYEQEIEQGLEQSGYHSIDNLEETKAKIMLAAKAHNEKRAVNFKISKSSIETFKQRVKMKTGLQYQTFLNMMIHKYNRGELDTVL